METREISFAVRQVDAATIADLFCVLHVQVKAAYDMSEALNCDVVMPYSQELLDIILDAVGAPDGQNFREPFYDLFYTRWLLNDEFATVTEFLNEFYFHLEDHLAMHKAEQSANDD